MEQKRQKAPQYVKAQNQSAERPATFIFLHGYGDDADGFINVAHQFQSAHKLPHLSWIFPNAPHNHEANTTAWYSLSSISFSPIPVGSSSSPSHEATEEDECDESAESDDEIWGSVAYTEGLIEKEVEKGVDVGRIVVGGFSQGCAVSLILGLAGRYKGKLGGLVGLSGYLPKGKRVWEGREELRVSRKKEEGGEMKVLLGHGTKDMLVPVRIFRETKERIVFTVGEDRVEGYEYQGLGHTANGAMFRDMYNFLEKVIPE
ncbi:uncharacterized protein RAG0_02364 [Rhynchosporium agropyri]|uniref:Acyl-protein thioesterase 1 n=1 Tax=Rhynchosporium agropyri TaxID=914238 RepID=A0A1E1K1F5_9HELO|nr:uncharacterized protein RAG0_02364 [Rhynchosporium agropyri]